VTTTAPPGGTTEAQAANARLTMAAGPSRTHSWRIDVLDAHLLRVGELHPVEPGIVVENNINRDVKRTCSGLVLPKAEAVSLNYFANRLRPVWIEPVGTEYPMGVFVISDASTIRHSWGTSAELSLVDQGLILSMALDRSISFPTGTPVRSAMLAVLGMLALPAYDVDTTDAQLGGTSTWAMGRDTWVRVLNDLAAVAGFNSGFFDNGGTYRLRRAPAAHDDTLPDFDYDSPPRVHADSVVESEATIESPNRYMVISTSGNQTTPVVGVWDVPADAPHSYEKRGYRVISMAERQGLSLADATEAARAKGLQDSDTYQWASFAAAADPRHDTYNVVRWAGALWREQGWSLPLVTGGEHRHELRRSYVAPGATGHLGLDPGMSTETTRVLRQLPTAPAPEPGPRR
jgi:hypothetical protein